MFQYLVFYGEYENEKKKEQQKSPPQQGFEPRIMPTI